MLLERQQGTSRAADSLLSPYAVGIHMHHLPFRSEQLLRLRLRLRLRNDCGCDFVEMGCESRRAACRQSNRHRSIESLSSRQAVSHGRGQTDAP
jgi:hypothetical protein